VEHVETIQPDDLPRFAAEGVTASMQTQHMMDLAPDRSDNWSRRLGPDRCDRAFLTRTIWDTGALVALGSDWPVVGLDPRESLPSTSRRAPRGSSAWPAMARCHSGMLVRPAPSTGTPAEEVP
jgi:predicted amidohydrolase YtcJ